MKSQGNSIRQSMLKYHSYKREWERNEMLARNKGRVKSTPGVFLRYRNPVSKRTRNRQPVPGFAKQFLLAIRRMATRHTVLGYKTAIFVALALGQYEIANFLKCCLAGGNVLVIR